jgi:hypothetical protein
MRDRQSRRAPIPVRTWKSRAQILRVEGQIRWRWRQETASRPELYSYLEVNFPLQRNRVLIGTQNWEGALGFGFLRGHAWGTLGGRVALAYDGEDSRLELGEYALEYIKSSRRRHAGASSPCWRARAKKCRSSARSNGPSVRTLSSSSTAASA